MNRYDFDTKIERRNTDCLKYDFAVERGKPAGVLPLWVADMDFRVPASVQQALRNSVNHGIFGYSDTKHDYYEAVAGWFARHFGWKPEETWLVKTPGVVFALAMAVRSLTQPGDSVLIQPPVYYPFYSVIRDNDRRIAENELLLQDGHYTIDFKDFERKIVENQVKLFLLCSPHNPIGRVWTRDELMQLGRICKKHRVFVVSDEIHCDFAFEEHPHTIFLQANPDMQDLTLVCTAPSKTFNLAGLQVSNIWIPDEAIRARFVKEIDRSGYSQLNTLGLTACKAAYTDGEEWLKECRAYLRKNLDFVRDFLAEHLPSLRLVEPEGTYFAWIDFSALGLTADQLDDLILNGAKLWLDSGHIFGRRAGQFQRFVLACPRATLEQAFFQLEAAIRIKNG